MSSYSVDRCVILDLYANHETSELSCTVDGLKEMGMNDAKLFTHTGLWDWVIRI